MEDTELNGHVSNQLRQLESMGPRLRQRRHEQGLTLQQVADMTGLTRAFLSRVERKGSSVSLDSLVRICAALGMTVASLFEQPTVIEPLRLTERKPSYFGGEGVVDYLLTGAEERRCQVLETEVEPLGSPGREFYTIDAEVLLLLVLSGTVIVELEGINAFRLSAGDSFYWTPRQPYRWSNPSSRDPASVLWVVVPAVF